MLFRSSEKSQELARHTERNMQLQASIQEGTLTLTGPQFSLDLEPMRWK